MKPVAGDASKVFCESYRQELQISKNSIDKIKQRERTAIHKKSLPNSQQKALTSASGVLSLIKSPKEKTVELSDRILTAETIKALRAVDVNGSFATSDGDPDRSARMLPDSKITYQYAQQSNKIKYMIVYSAASYILQLLINGLKNSFFNYKFNEITTVKIDKQYDGYATYISKKFVSIVTSYLGSLFVGPCNHKKFVEHFFVFLDKVDLSPRWLLNIGMDGHTS